MTSLSFKVCRTSGLPGDSSHHDAVGLHIGAEQEGLRPRRMEAPLLVEPARARIALPHGEPNGILAAACRLGERALHQSCPDAGAERRLARVEARDLEHVA